jgi:hypothetical protein
MYQNHLVAFFPSVDSAQQARARLMQAGIAEASIRLSGESDISTRRRQDTEDEGFFSWLFGSEDSVPDNEREWYRGNLREGRAMLSVRVASEDELRRTESLLEQAGALEVERDDEGVGSGSAMQTRSGTTASRGSSGKTARRGAAEEEEVIPVVKEELAVGKRATETRRRIRTHVIERPVQQQVELQDETMIVERRPATGASAARGDLQEREYEIIERHEEPVVEKRAQTAEEVVVKKNVKKRTETVSDKVRETQVEVEGDVEGDTVEGNSIKGQQRRR